ncbi:MAG: NADH-quinone oxidoreductase subunit N [Phycisphaerales bacterium]|nr:NADH-quinone oxidoreductase subunit N [Phycisphaerales bacterium]
MIEKLWFVIPEAVLLVGVVVVAILGLVRSGQIRNRVPWVAMAFVIGCGVAYPFVFTETAVSESTSLLPGLGRPMGLVACVVGVCLVFMTIGRIDRRYEQAIAEGRDRFDPLRSNRGEYYVFFLLSLAGLMLTCSANDLIWLFLALELTSLPTYVMVAMSRSSRRAQEAAMKYFFLGAMSAAMFLYGFSLLYAATGTVELTEMREILTAQAAEGGISMLAVVGMMLALLGIGFKLAAAPMHLYAADVYEGAAVHVTAVLGFIPKAAGAVAFMLLLSTMGWFDGSTLPLPILILLWVMAVLTMTLGNVAALLQRSVKRMLAYSSISHSGYLLIGIIAGPGLGFSAVILYLFVYGLANTGAFAVLASLEREGREIESVEDLAGLRQKHPGSAIALAISSGSLLGFPPLLGFWGKLALFIAGIASGHIVLVLIAGVNSAISAWYYLRLVGLPLMSEPSERSETIDRVAVPWPRFAAIGIAAAMVVLPIFLAGIQDETDVPLPPDTADVVATHESGDQDASGL